MKAKRIEAGQYEYRGWEIEKVEIGCWNIREIGEMYYTDSFDTKAEAMEMINYYKEQEAA